MPVQERMNTALAIAAEGSRANIVKPLTNLGRGVMQIAVRYQKDAYRTIFAMDRNGELCVIHAFKKKSKKGIATPRADIRLIRRRLNHWRNGGNRE